MKIFLDRKNIHLSNNTIHEYIPPKMKLYYLSRHRKSEYQKVVCHKLFSNLLRQNFIMNEANHIWYTNFTFFILLLEIFVTTAILLIFITKVLSLVRMESLLQVIVRLEHLIKLFMLNNCDDSKLILYSDQEGQFSSVIHKFL